MTKSQVYLLVLVARLLLEEKQTLQVPYDQKGIDLLARAIADVEAEATS